MYMYVYKYVFLLSGFGIFSDQAGCAFADIFFFSL